MEYIFAMIFITYAMMGIMLTGCMLVNVVSHSLRNEDLTDEERLNSEAFLMNFFDQNFFGKVNFIMFHGARFWAIVFGETFKRKG